MRRIALIAVGLLGLIVVSAALARGGSEGGYLIRAYFDNGSFTVAGQDVRVGGANVGTIEEVDVSMPGEPVSHVPGKEVKPGTALVVLRITDPGYQDFRADASCILRPQSLIGERVVDCKTTEPRADSEAAPPELELIADGQPGEGQRMLPLENNGRAVDIDLVNNIYREPFRDRFRLILNELGAGFATRGEDLAEIVERADPTLREGNKVLEKLAAQRHTLAQLTRDSDEILEPLAAARGDIVGFLENAEAPAAVTAARREQLEEALGRFPTFLRELRTTMTEFDQFTSAAAPVLEDLGVAAPDMTQATKALAPFAEASTTALTSLGRAGEKAGPRFTEAHPIVRRAMKLAKTGVAPTRDLDELLLATKTTGGFQGLMELIYNTGASVNGFDQYGTYFRTYLLPENCVDYLAKATFNCNQSFRDVAFRASARETSLGAAMREQAGVELEPTSPDSAEQDSAAPPPPAPGPAGDAPAAEQGSGLEGRQDAAGAEDGAAAATERSPRTAARDKRDKRATKDLYRYLLGS